jgi:hypothetical protein
MEPLVTWNHLDLTITGSRIAQLVQHAIRERKVPVQDLKLQFREGEVLVTGRVIKVISIPFQFAVRRVELAGNAVRIPLEGAAAFGFLPLPKLLLSLFGQREVSDGVTVHPESLSVSVRLERFLPPFVDLTVQAIDLVEGGVRVRCSAGGADLPPSRGGL